MSYTEEDFKPAETNMQTYVCGCENHGIMFVSQIKYVDEEGHLHRVCYRQQCQSCGFLRKNRLGKILYYSIKEGPEMFNYLPEYFWAPEEITFNENKEYNRNAKIDFMRRILTLANRNAAKLGHLEFTKEQIYSVEFPKKA